MLDSKLVSNIIQICTRGSQSLTQLGKLSKSCGFSTPKLLDGFDFKQYIYMYASVVIIIEFLGETRIIIIIQIIIISAGTPLVSNSFHLSWNPKYIEFWDQYILVFSKG